jgi:Na+/H+-dicarboxylate symporter
MFKEFTFGHVLFVVVIYLALSWVLTNFNPLGIGTLVGVKK